MMQQRQQQQVRGGDTAASSAKLPKDKKCVKFDQITIIEFPIIVGDNPGSNSSSGVPISIGWHPLTTRVQNLDLYEHLRKPVRMKDELTLSDNKRRKRLKSAGYTDSQIERAIEEVETIRKSRRDCFPSPWVLFFKSFKSKKGNKGGGGGGGGGVGGVGWTGKTMRKVLAKEEVAGRSA